MVALETPDVYRRSLGEPLNPAQERRKIRLRTPDKSRISVDFLYRQCNFVM
jgi:hypothetical protein